MRRKTITVGGLFFAAVLTFGRAAPALELNVPLYYQETDMWCWDASAQMVIHYYGEYYPEQCEIANWAFGLSYCCSYPYDYYCAQGNWVTTSNGVLGILWNWGVDASPVYSYISQSQVVSEIDAGDPFPIHFRWTSGGGHVLVGVGYEYGGDWLIYHDPWYGTQYVDYWWAVSASDHWWEETVTTNGGGTPQPGSCVGYCGGESPDGCYCDDQCAGYGDCCPDYEQVCGGAPDPNSCVGYCGGEAPGGCYCDRACIRYGDCCDDAVSVCNL